MSPFRFSVTGAIAAFAIVFGGQQASAQQASGQFYGYASGQGPMASGQGQHGPGCYPSQPCQIERAGCRVIYCEPRPTCHSPINIPDSQVPACHTGQVIWSDKAPPPACQVTIWRNHYVPIRVRHRDTPVQPVDILVKWREVHYLCDCEPGTEVNCPHGPSGSPQHGSPQQGSPQAGASVVPTPNSPLLYASAPAAPATPAAPVVVQEVAPAKRWVWLQKQNLYGFGFQRPDGLWVIDPATKRPTLPEGETIQPTRTTAAVTDTASTGS